jgi:hypothetical protein
MLCRISPVITGGAALELPFEPEYHGLKRPAFSPRRGACIAGDEGYRIVTSLDRQFVEEFEHLMSEVEHVIQEFPPEMRPALRDEARVTFRLELQRRWEELQARLERLRGDPAEPAG